MCITPKVDQKAKSAQFVDKAQCDPQAVESVHEGKVHITIHKPRVAFVSVRCTIVSNTCG